MKKIMFVALVMSCALAVFGEGSITYSKEAVTKERIQKVLSEKYNATLDSDGDTMIVNSGRKIFVIQDKKRDAVIIRWAAYAKDYARADKLNLCQEYNRDKIMIRFYLDKDSDYVADYFLPYDGGLNSENLKVSVAWFCSVLDDFVKASQKLQAQK